MALTECPKCGKPVSDKAMNCPNCGETIDKNTKEEVVKLCEDCGMELPENCVSCPNCGCPVSSSILEKDEPSSQKPEISATNLPVAKKATKKYVILGFVAVIVIGIIIAIALTAKNVSEQNAKEEYSKNLNSASIMMLTGAAEAEETGNLIKSVWYNTIYEEYDLETDKYTQSNGYGFNDDFNDSLTALFDDSDFNKKITNIKDNQELVSQIMKLLQNPPEGCEESYRAIQDYYNAYLILTNLAVSPTGTLQTYSSDFNSADSELNRCYQTMKIYID